MKIVWLLLAVALVGAGYFLGRSTQVRERPSGPPPKMLAVVPSAGDVAPENVEYIAAIYAAINEPMLLDRTSRTADLLLRLSPSNVGDAIAALRGAAASHELKALLYDGWVQFDGLAAFDYVQTLREFPRTQATPQLLEGWATLDPPAARRAFQTLPHKAESPRQRGDDALSGLARGWARSGQPGLFEFLSKQGPGMVRQNIVEFAVSNRLARDGAESVEMWADGILQVDELSDSFKKTILNRVAALLSRRDGEAASGWAAKYAETLFAVRVLNGVSNGWVLRDGDATMQWLASLPSNTARDQVVDQAYSFWLRQKPQSAMDWMEAAERNRAWEPALAAYALKRAETDPRAALASAREVGSHELRASCLIGIGQIWYREDPGPATAWLEESELSPEQQQLVTTPPKIRRRGLQPGERPRPGR